jgi:hypothetical protein
LTDKLIDASGRAADDNLRARIERMAMLRWSGRTRGKERGQAGRDGAPGPKVRWGGPSCRSLPGWAGRRRGPLI